MYDRIVDGIGTVLLTLKKRPVIRYSQTCVPLGPALSHAVAHRPMADRAAALCRSETAQRIAQDVRRLTYEQVRRQCAPTRAAQPEPTGADSRPFGSHSLRNRRCSTSDAAMARCCCSLSTDWTTRSRRCYRNGRIRRAGPQHVGGSALDDISGSVAHARPRAGDGPRAPDH
jgi:hypothetical protein